MTTKEQYARFENVPDGSTIDRSNGRVIVWYPRGERVVVKLGGGPAPWEILTAEDARSVARYIAIDGWTCVPNCLRAYADAVDAMLHVGYPERDMQTTDEELGY